MTFQEVKRKVEIELRDTVMNNPNLSYRQIGRMYGTSIDTVEKICAEFHIRRKAGRKRRPRSLRQ